MTDAILDIRCAIDADAATRDAAALAERMREIGAWSAFSAMQTLRREREVRADRVWAMTQQTLRSAAQATQPRPPVAR